MRHQNITLSLPKELLQKIKHIAIDRQTSVSGLLTQILEEIVHKEDAYAFARQIHLDILSKGYDLHTNGERSWSREDLYERK